MLRAGFTYPAAIHVTDNIIRKEGIAYALSWLEMMATEMEVCDAGVDDMLRKSAETVPATYGFHKIDTMYIGEIEVPWILKQPGLV